MCLHGFYMGLCEVMQFPIPSSCCLVTCAPPSCHPVPTPLPFAGMSVQTTPPLARARWPLTWMRVGRPRRALWSWAQTQRPVPLLPSSTVRVEVVQGYNKHLLLLCFVGLLVFYISIYASCHASSHACSSHASPSALDASQRGVTGAPKGQGAPPDKVRTPAWCDRVLWRCRGAIQHPHGAMWSCLNPTHLMCVYYVFCCVTVQCVSLFLHTCVCT